MRYIKSVSGYPVSLNIFMGPFMYSSIINYSFQFNKMSCFTNVLSTSFFWYNWLGFSVNYLIFCSAKFWLLGIVARLVLLSNNIMVCWIKSGNLIWLNLSKYLVVQNLSMNSLFQVVIYSINFSFIDRLFLFLYKFGKPSIYRKSGLVINSKFYWFLSFKNLKKGSKMKGKG